MINGDPSDARERAGSSRALNFIASASAVLLSIVSLSVAISANRTQERLLAASVWPSLEYGTGNRDDSGADVISLAIGNSGIGPARLRTVQVLYLDQAAKDSEALLKSCCELAKGTKLTTITSSTRARVVKPGEDVEFLRLARTDNDDALWQRFNKARFDIRVKACYCSVLDDCWMLDSTAIEPRAVATCPAVPDEQQWHG